MHVWQPDNCQIDTMIGALRVIDYFWIAMSVLAFVANSFSGKSFYVDAK